MDNITSVTQAATMVIKILLTLILCVMWQMQRAKLRSHLITRILSLVIFLPPWGQCFSAYATTLNSVFLLETQNM